MTALLQPFAEALFDALRPIERAMREPAYLGVLARRAGHRVSFERGALDASFSGLRTAGARATTALRDGESALEALAGEDLGTEARALAVADLLAAGRELVSAVDTAQAALSAADLSALPEPLRDPEAWRDLFAALPQLLLVDWLEGTWPTLHGALRLVEVIDADGLRIDLDALAALVNDPTKLAERMGWPPTEAAAAEPLLEGILDLLGALGLPARIEKVREPWVTRYLDGDGAVTGLTIPVVEGYLPGGYATFGLTVFPVTGASLGDVGLVLGLIAEGEVATSLVLDEAGAWRLDLWGGASGTGSAAVELTVAGVYGALDDPEAGAGASLTFAPTAPWAILGSAPGSRVELGGLLVAFELSTDDVALTASLEELRVVLASADAGPFLSELFGDQDVEVAADLQILWSAKQGLRFQGESQLTHRVPIAKQLGPLYVDALTIGVSGGDGLTFLSTLDLSVQLPVLSFTAADLGLQVALRGATGNSGNLGPFEAEAGFQPPSLLGIGFDAAVGSGGGVLRFDPVAGEYTGSLQVDVLDVGISATGMLATKLPGVDWSLFVSLHASFTGLQLGFGFTLEKVGGLFGAHRTLDAQALGDAVRSGSLDAVLFPEDAIAAAPQIFAALDGIFPPKPDQFVFGPIARIGWGTPTLITADVGIVVQLPDPVTITLLGSLQVRLPREDLVLVELNVDVAGTLDLTAATLSVDASLRQSHVLGLDLHGDMALRASFGDEPSFLFAFGGFHPSFTPPASFPSLRRLGVSLDSGEDFSLELSGYFAVTSNTLQFGAHADLWAKASGLTVEGHVGFDALLTYVPFGFEIDLGFSVDVRAGNVDLFGVALDLALEGPNPWRATGTATVKVAGLKKGFRVEARIGKKEDEGPAPEENAEELLLEALRRHDAWRAVPGSARVVYRDVDEAALAVDPDGSVELVQRVLPLERTLDHLGSARVEGPDRFAFTDPRLGGEAAEAAPVEDWFAPAGFFELAKKDKLSGPSFERMVAGARIGATGARADAPQRRELGWEEIVVDPASETPPRRDQPALAPARLPSAGLASPFRLAQPEVRLVDAISGEASPRTLSWSEAARRRGPREVVVPTWEEP